MNEYYKLMYKAMASTGLNNDLERLEDHKKFHLTPWQHQDCVHCQIEANKLKK